MVLSSVVVAGAALLYCYGREHLGTSTPSVPDYANQEKFAKLSSFVRLAKPALEIPKLSSGHSSMLVRKLVGACRQENRVANSIKTMT
jgi:hypothetical protein